jgi:hypothetical protein
MSRPDPVTREVSPCKDCQDRNPGCHDKCKMYAEWKERLNKLNRARKEYAEKPRVKVDGCW